MTDEEINRKFELVADHLAALAVSQQKAEERATRADTRIDRLERVLMLAIRAGQRERNERREKTNTLEDAMTKLAESQAHADRRLDALIDIVQGGKQ